MDLVINEVLCFTVKNLHRLGKSAITDLIAKFYHDDELYAAKLQLNCHVQLLLSLTNPPTIDGWSRFVNKQGTPIVRKASDGMAIHLAHLPSESHAVKLQRTYSMMNHPGQRMLSYVTAFSTTTMATVNFISYNLHGINNGRSGLTDPDKFIIAIQEHWLSPDKLHLLNEIHPDFIGVSISSMCEVCCGRPYGGVGFLWRKSLARISVQYRSHSGRVMSVLLNLCDNTKISIVMTYFPF